MKFMILGAMLFGFVGCASVKEVSYKGGIGNELRGNSDSKTDHRFGVKSGIETKFINGVSVDAVYRNRVTDFKKDSMEHGFFMGVKVPLWKRSK